MRKRITIILLLLVAVAVQGLTQEIKVPKWEKFVSVNRDGVNLRKGPGTNFPILMWISNIHAYNTEYLWNKTKGAEPYRTSTKTIFPVIKEVNGWYMINFADRYHMFEAYVRKDMCREKHPSAINIKTASYEDIGIDKVKGSDDIFVTCYDDSGNWSDPFLWFGKKWGNVILWFDYGDDGWAFARRECRATDDFLWFNADMLNSENVKKFMSSHRQRRDWGAVSYSFGQGQLTTFFFNPLTYKHAMTTEPVAYSSASTGKNSHTTVSKNMNLSFKENAAVDEDDDLGLNGENAVKEYKAMVEKLKRGKATSNLDLINEVVKESQLYAEKYKDVKLTDAQKAEIEQLMKEVEDMSGNSEEDTVYEVVEQLPKFPGGDAALIQYLSSHVKYPATAEENGITGRVLCSFIVEKDGSISNVKVSKGVEASLDAEAVRVLKSMPKWIPGKQNGKTVRVKFTTPVTFRLH